MKWYAVDWFGGIKVECESCHHYTTEWTKEESENLFLKQYREGNWTCNTCELQTEVMQLRAENKKLQASLYEWKYGTGGWCELREIIGDLWWHHPAIDNDEKRTYYQDVITKWQKSLPSSNDVYVDGKLVGSSISTDAILAIRRLMKM